MTKMLTLFGEDIGKLPYNDLKRERAMQRFLLSKVKKVLRAESYKLDKMEKPTQVSKDKVAILEIYLSHLEALIEEIDYWLNRRFEPEDNWKRNVKRKWKIREENQQKRKENIAENARLYKWEKTLDRDRFLTSWDKEKFMSIATDRGYQTEEALIQDVGKALNLDRARAIRILENGRFTWGQVLCLGAMMQVTPKEFCDTFLNGYFVNQFDEYRADFDNISKAELLKPPIRPMPIADEIDLGEMEVVEVDSDGRPLDEEEWFE